MRTRPILAGLMALFAFTTLQAGESVVWFIDGRTLVVESIHVAADVATLRLAGGSQLVVPAARIERHHRSAPVVVVKPAPPLPPAESWSRLAGEYAETIRNAARRHGLDPVLLTAMAKVESGFDPRAVSVKGAEGLLQLMPATAQRFGVLDSFDPAQNVEGGAQYLKWLLERFSGDEQLALAGYNAGEAAVDRYRGIPPFPETENYVVRVLGHAERLRGAPALAR